MVINDVGSRTWPIIALMSVNRTRVYRIKTQKANVFLQYKYDIIIDSSNNQYVTRYHRRVSNTLPCGRVVKVSSIRIYVYSDTDDVTNKIKKPDKRFISLFVLFWITRNSIAFVHLSNSVIITISLNIYDLRSSVMWYVLCPLSDQRICCYKCFKTYKLKFNNLSKLIDIVTWCFKTARLFP